MGSVCTDRLKALRKSKLIPMGIRINPCEISQLGYSLVEIFFFLLRFHFLIRGSCHLIIPVQKTIPKTAVATKLVTPG